MHESPFVLDKSIPPNFQSSRRIASLCVSALQNPDKPMSSILQLQSVSFTDLESRIRQSSQVWWLSSQLSVSSTGALRPFISPPRFHRSMTILTWTKNIVQTIFYRRRRRFVDREFHCIFSNFQISRIIRFEKQKDGSYLFSLIRVEISFVLLFWLCNKNKRCVFVFVEFHCIF